MRAPRLAALLSSLIVVASLTAGTRGWSGPHGQTGERAGVLRLGTTTSTVDTGLLGAILPDFEARCACRVEVIAVGTGQAIELGRRGDADVLLVHAPEQEAAFVKEGHAARRDDVMYNDFVVVGPADDPAGVQAAATVKDVFRRIAAAPSSFVSRGDRSGTHTRELAIWTSIGLAPSPSMSWYLSVGQGMGETLGFANERQAYALSDRATWLSMQARLKGLRQLFGGRSIAENPDRDLRNQYGVLVVDGGRHPGVNAVLARRFAEWLLSKPTQERIGAFGREAVGQPLFYPDSDDYKSTTELRVVSGAKSRLFTLAELRAMPKATLANHEVVGVRKGPLGKHQWTGASLRGLLLAVDPALAGPANGKTTIEIVSSDGWTATVAWQELFGRIGRGEGLYRARGCNECHGLNAEGTRPGGKRPAPRLAGRTIANAATLAMIRNGSGPHAGITAYTAERLSDADLQAILTWLANPAADTSTPYAVDPARQALVLAYQRDGKPMTGRDGLIQLVVGPDDFASRYSHWVAEIRVR